MFLTVRAANVTDIYILCRGANVDMGALSFLESYLTTETMRTVEGIGAHFGRTIFLFRRAKITI